MAGELTRKEINQTPIALRNALSFAKPLPTLNKGGEHLFVSSGILLYIADAMARMADMFGIRARALPAQDLFLYRKSLYPAPRAIVMLSRTGEVSENIKAIQAARQDNVADFYTGIIGEAGGPLVQLLDQAVECRIYEVSVATTSTLNAVLTACTASLLFSAGKSLDVADLHSIPGMAAPLVARLDQEARVLVSLGCKQVMILGTGPLYGLAKAAALSIFEMSQVPAVGLHTMVFRHGHKVAVDQDTLMIFFLSDSGMQEEMAVLEEVQAMGARTAVVGEGVSKIKYCFVSELGSGVKETVRLPLYMIFAQLVGYHLALLVGRNPDAPPRLLKVF
ncbi:MAG TPA: hypothetical protein GXX29_10990 [Firmicutes bacterium]|nr:hypothetical protein [Bacillota bacterium]